MRVALVGYGAFASGFAYTLLNVKPEAELTIFIRKGADPCEVQPLGMKIFSRRLLEELGAEIVEYSEIDVRVRRRAVLADGDERTFDRIVLASEPKILQIGGIYRGLSSYTVTMAVRERKPLFVKKEEIPSFADSDMWNALVNELRKAEVPVAIRDYMSPSLGLDAVKEFPRDSPLPEDLEIAEGVFAFGGGALLRDPLTGVKYRLVNPTYEYKVGVALALALALGKRIRLRPLRVEACLVGEDRAYAIVGATAAQLSGSLAYRARMGGLIVKMVYSRRDRRLAGVQILGETQRVLAMARYYAVLISGAAGGMLDAFLAPSPFVPGLEDVREPETLALEGLVRRIPEHELAEILAASD